MGWLALGLLVLLLVQGSRACGHQQFLGTYVIVRFPDQLVAIFISIRMVLYIRDGIGNVKVASL